MAGDCRKTRARINRGLGSAVDGRQGWGHGRPRVGNVYLFSNQDGASIAEPGCAEGERTSKHGDDGDGEYIQGRAGVKSN